MPKTKSTTLSDKDLKVIAVFLREFRKKNVSFHHLLSLGHMLHQQRYPPLATQRYPPISKQRVPNNTETVHPTREWKLTPCPGKQKSIATAIDWKPYYDTFGFKNDKAAKDAFDYACMKLANIENSMGAGPSTPDGKGGDDTPASSAAKKAAPARAQRKRKQAANKEDDDESPSKRARTGGNDEEDEEVFDEI
ncbi:hypothetical protein PG985_014372 [Apiospora marii]|uniref:AP2/ERF domain-containing protein n=1 Tax=Apiospora marii TaxID=335849 RepID=A0ABR1R5G6_9PEZI